MGVDLMSIRDSVREKNNDWSSGLNSLGSSGVNLGWNSYEFVFKARHPAQGASVGGGKDSDVWVIF